MLVLIAVVVCNGCRGSSQKATVPDGNDNCPADPNKTEPGICGCGVSDVDSENDGLPDCLDGCPNDPDKTEPGICGCGISDVDSDNDGSPDCIDGCPNDPDKITPGACGCGVTEIDSDRDGTPDCIDGCPNDPNKITPGACGCGVTGIDSDRDGYTAIGSCSGSANDCNDEDSSIHPGAAEINGDGIDQDCDGLDSAVPDVPCFGCHNINRTNFLHTLVAAPDATCVNCHAAPVTNVANGHYGLTVKTAGNNMAAGAIIDCYSCHDWHDDDFYTIPGANIVWAKVVSAEALTCDACHEDRAAAHETDTVHDNRVIDESCAVCHAIDTNADVDILHYSDCATCHAYNGTKLDVATVEKAIQDGINGIMISCTTCHGDFTTIHSHHSGADNDVRYNAALDTSQAARIGCAVCHHDYDTFNGTSLGLSTWETILIEHDLDGIKDGSTDTCLTCHAYDGSGSPPLAAVQNAIASGNPATCATCHTDKVPDTDHGIPDSGQHPTHLDMTGVSCGTCHLVGGYPFFKSGTDSNGDGRYNLAETDVCDICHQDGSGNPATGFKDGWSDPEFVLPCDSCHAAPPATGTHLAHFSGADATLIYGDTRITQDFTGGDVSSVNMIGCGNCHPMDVSFHGNRTWGDIEFSNILAPADSLKALNASGSYDQAIGTCRNIYCHSANSWTTSGTVPEPWPESTGWDKNIDPLPRPLPDNIVTGRVYRNVTWDSGETLTCNGCHDYPPQTSSVDNDGGAGDSHYWIDPEGYENLHVWNMGFTAIGCRTCHYDTVREWDQSQGQGWDIDESTLRRFYYDVALYDKAKHVNGSVDVTFDTVNNFTYDGPEIYDLSPASFDPETKTCSNVACHIEETKVIWGLPYRWYNYDAECDRCHGFY